MRRRAGAVAEAVQRGARVESADDGLAELTQMAAKSGPPRVPRNLGNFAPESGGRLDDAGDGERGPSRGARRAAAREGKRATVTRINSPRRLPTFDDERAEKNAKRIVRGEEPEQLEDDERELDAAEPLEDDEEQDLDDEDEDLDDEDLDDEDLDARGDDDLPEGDDVRDFAGLRNWLEERDARRDQQLEAALARASRAPATPPGAAAANDPRVAQIAQALRYDNIVPFQITAADREALGLTEAGAQKLETMFRVQAFTLAQRIVTAYNLDQELRARQAATERAQADEHQSASDAFWHANPDLKPYADDVLLVSSHLSREYAGKLSQAQWVQMTGRIVRQRLRRLGVRVGASAPPRGVRRAAPGGAIRPHVTHTRPRVRPATMDLGSGGGRGIRAGTRLTAMEKDVLDLARYGGGF